MSWIVNLIFGVIANLITLGLIALTAKIPSSLSRRDPRRGSRLLFILIALIPILNLGYSIYMAIEKQTGLWLLPVPISFSILVFLLWKQLDQFWTLGIRGADRRIVDGIKYCDALKLVQNELKFLGIGASKLSRENEFALTLSRCMQEEPIKFLLCSPDDPRLTRAAKKFERPENEYRDVVRESIRKIARLKDQRSLNIEVRFYPVECNPVFRLMFIDDSICLFSYNVWGEGDGSQYPQLYIVNAPAHKRVVQSFYYPLKVYFDDLWNQSTPWKLSDFLE